MKIGGVHHLALQVRYLGPMVSFYRDVLGLPVIAEHLGIDGAPRSVWLGLPGGAFLALERVTGEVAPPSPFHDELPGWFLMALRIAPEARAGVLAELQRAKVTVEHQTGWSIYVRDPEGNRVALSHHPEPAPGPP